MFYLFLKGEFNQFVINTYTIYSEINYIHGIIHPAPFSDDPNSARATKTLISILICLIISIKLFFNSNKKFSNSFKFVLIYIAFIGFLTYLNALGRSDGPHIKSTFGYPLIFLTLFFFNLLLLYINNKYKNFYGHKNKLFFLFVFVCFFNFDLNYNNISKYNERFDNYTNLPDYEFLENKEIELLNKLSPIVKKYECIQLFSNDAALLYLLKGKSCSKYYFTWSVGSKTNQKELVNYLNGNNMVIYGGDSFKWNMPLSKKLPYVNNYIFQNYILMFELNNYKVFKKKN